MKKLALFLIAVVYILTARIHSQSLETVISKHPLFIYSVIVLVLMITSLRLQGKSKTIVLWIELFFLILYYISLIIGG